MPGKAFFYNQIELSTNTFEPWVNPTYGLNKFTQHFVRQARTGDFWAIYDGDVRPPYRLVHFSKDWILLNSIPIPTGVRLGEYVGTFMVEDRHGQIWIGAADGDLLRFDPVTNHIDVYSYAHVMPKSGGALRPIICTLIRPKRFGFARIKA